MRSRQAFKNMAASLILQVIVFLSGIILPRFFLEAYGSSVNGLVTSANQFLMYLGLAESGIDPKTLQYIMGHSGIAVTMDIYNHVDTVRVKNEMEKAEDVIKYG